MQEIEKEYKYTFEVDYDNLTVKFGNWEYDCTLNPRLKKVSDTLSMGIIEDVMYKNTIPKEVGTPYPKSVYVAFTKEFEITPNAFIKQLSNRIYNVLAHGLDTRTFKHMFHYNKSGNRQRLLSNFKESKPLLIQCVQDGISNVAPIVCITGKSPKELKDILGKGVWKKYCKRSITANHLAAQVLNQYSNKSTFMIGNRFVTKNIFEKLSYVLKVPITVLKYSRYIPSEHVCRLIKEAKVCSKPSEVKRLENIVLDTQRMARDLGEPFNVNWSWNRINQEHERLTKLKTKGIYSDRVIECETYSYLEKRVECEYGQAVLLGSEMEVVMEGKNMRHCVAGYAKLCSKGEYAVYHIIANDGEESTLGMRYTTYGWMIDQHYGICNNYVNDNSKRVATRVRSSILQDGKERMVVCQ